MKVLIIINNVWSRIKGLNDIQISDNLDKITSYYVEGYQYTKAFREGFFNKKENRFTHWDGRRHLLTQKMIFPTGLLQRVLDFFKLNNVEVEIVDNRQLIDLGEEISIRGKIPRPYQIDALNRATEAGRGIIRMGTGSGKTFLAAMIVAKYNVPTMIYVVGKDLLYQFYTEMEKALGIEIGLIGDGHCNIKKINICSVWTAITAFDVKLKTSLDDEDWIPEIISVDSKQKQEIKEIIEKSNLSIYDEAHFLATDTLQLIFKASKQCRFHFGLSGTDWRDDGADLLLESVCGRRIYNMPSSRLIDDGFLVQPKIVFFEVPPIQENASDRFSTVYNKYITKNEIRNGMIEESARKLIQRGRKVLILVRYISHGKEIAERLSDIPLFFVNGEVDGITRQEVKKSFEAGYLKCLIASSVFDIGVDIPSLDALILGGGGKSTVRAMQRIGRVIRSCEGKKNALVVDFIDNSKYLNKHSAIRIAIYETESRFILKFPKGFDYASIKRQKKIKEKVKEKIGIT